MTDQYSPAQRYVLDRYGSEQNYTFTRLSMEQAYEAGFLAGLKEKDQQIRPVIEAAQEWLDDTSIDCDHQPGWQALSGALKLVRTEDSNDE